MRIEVIIYIYGAICVSMIAFNIAYSIMLTGREPRMEKRCKNIREKINYQILQLKQGKKVEEEHKAYLRKKLGHINYLIAFNQVFQEDFEKDPKLYYKYMDQIRSVIIYIAVMYQDKDDIFAGYFTYFLSCCIERKQLTVDSLQDILMDYMKKPNLYCRVNALKALYHFAAPEYVAKAIRIQDDEAVFIHEKIITEGLLSYTGDHSKLISCLWKEYNFYSDHTKHAILNYIRFCSGDYKKEMFEIMIDENLDKELRISAIRYFGKYKDDKAKSYLLSFVKDKDYKKWEYATVAASSLASYSGDDVVEALKDSLHSGNWYIRYSAAQSLDMLKINYMDIMDITSGNDRYAREMMMYRLESRKLQEQEV